MSEIIVKMNDNHIKIKGGEYVQDIVRCKECRHWNGCKSTAHNNHLCGRAKEQNVDYWTRADDFCSYGEREGE